MNNQNPTTTITSPTWAQLKEVVRATKAHLFICSPWLARSGLDKLKQFIDELEPPITLKHIQFWTRLADPETDSGFLLQLIEAWSQQGITTIVKDSPRLHAKIYMADKSFALIGSANLSESGFERHLEVVEQTNDQMLIDQIVGVIEKLKPDMRDVKLEHLRYFVEEQLPTVVEREEQSRDEKPAIVPIWRTEEPAVQVEPPVEITEQMTQPTDSPVSLEVRPTVSSDEFVRRFDAKLEYLDQNRKQLAEIDFENLVGKWVKVSLWPNTEGRLLMSTMINGGDGLEHIEGKFEKAGRMVDECISYQATVKHGCETTGMKRPVWEFRKRRARSAKYKIVNFPAPQNTLTPLYYLVELKVL